MHIHANRFLLDRAFLLRVCALFFLQVGVRLCIKDFESGCWTVGQHVSALQVMKSLIQIIVVLIVAPLVGCDRGSVSDTPISQCFPSGKCGKEMLERGFTVENGNLANGAKLYQSNCATCHGPAGEGTAKSGKIDMTTSVWQAKLSDTAIANVVRLGRPPIMPSFSFSKGELQDLVKHLRALQETTTKKPIKGGY